MRNLFEIQRVMLNKHNSNQFYYRQCFNQITLDNYLTAIVGSRGIGKTSLLLDQAIQHGANDEKALYISADNIYFVENKLIDLADELYKESDVRLLCVDEIHKYPNWQQELKNIADIYSDIKILFTSSSMIDIVHSKYDLSRRVTLYHLHGLSFREYLEFYHQIKLPMTSLDAIVKNHKELANQIQISNILKLFNDYLEMGYYPFFKRFTRIAEKFEAVENTIQKVIYEDISTLHNLKTSSLQTIEKIYKYVLSSQPGELNANKLANLLNKDFSSISSYITYMQQAGLLRFLFSNKTGKAYLRNPEKMYPENCNMLYAAYLPQFEDSIKGKEREIFILSHLQNAGYKVYYPDRGDFITNKYVFEVGGKNKTKNQIRDLNNAYIAASGILIGDKNTIPLYLFGLLY